MLNPSILLYGPGSAKLEDRPLPDAPQGHDVIVRIEYVGVCGSDVHFWKHGGVQTKVSEQNPLVMGHEAAGSVHSIGEAVESVKVGDHVAIEPGVPCRRCRACKDGFYNLCRNMRFAAAPPNNHGTLTKFFTVPEDFIYRIPDGMDLQEAVLFEPLSVAVHAVRVVDVRPGHDVVIMGSGTIGLLCAAVARAFGAQKTVLVDVAEKKLEFAKEFLGCDTYLSRKEDSSEETALRLRQQFDLEDGCDIVIEASGAEPCVQAGIHVLKLGGSYIQTGLGRPKIEFPILTLSEKELKVHGCFRYGPGDYELAMKLVSKGSIRLRPLISSVTPFERATEAWDKTGRGEGIKNLIRGFID